LKKIMIILSSALLITGLTSTPAAADPTAALITGFSIGLATGTINDVAGTIAITVPVDIDVTALQPTITVSTGATVSPVSGAPTNFTDPYNYEVTSQDGNTTKFYAVTVRAHTKLLIDPEVDGDPVVGVAKVFTVSAFVDDSVVNVFAGQKFVTITATDGVVTGEVCSFCQFDEVLLTFIAGVAEFTLTFSSVGAKTITATEGGLTGTLSVTVEAAPAAPVITLVTITGTATVGETLTAVVVETTGVPTPTLTYQWGADEATIDGATGSTFELTAAQVGKVITVTVTATNGVGSSEVTSAETSPVAAAAVEETPAEPAPTKPAPTTPVTTPASTPGFFSGKKWTITIDDAGVSTLDINLAKSQAGKNASFYKRTKQGKLILLDEEQRLGKNGKASITTDKLLRTGQKVRVQVDGKFRSTVTMP
jgi:hypothetical protein